MSSELRILMLEDSDRDAELIERLLRQGGLSFRVSKVEAQDEFVDQLDGFNPDIVISDYQLPSFNGMRALEFVRERSPLLPFILVSGHIGEERATDALKNGATDFVLKDRLERLVPCVRRALREVEERAEHRRLGERFRLFVEASPNAMVMIDANHQIEMVNAQTERLFGFAREELLGQTTDLLFPERFRVPHTGPPLACFATHSPDAPRATGDLFGRRSDGREFPVEIELNPIDTGAGTEILYIIVDISERRRIEAEKDRQRLELERSNADLEGFAYIASHDLKAPLRAIGHLADWIQEDIAVTASPETIQNLDLLQGRVARLQRLLDGLLDYSRIGRVDSPVEETDITQLVHDIATMRSPGHGFSVACLEPMTPIRTHVAPLRVVLENLIGNALKHHDRGEGLVTVAMRRVDDGSEFRVTDDGPGIDPRFHERIFWIFQTLASRDDLEASGIGLAIVKRQVEGHGGRIWVESAPPMRGTTFAFTWKDAPR